MGGQSRLHSSPGLYMIRARRSMRRGMRTPAALQTMLVENIRFLHITVAEHSWSHGGTNYSQHTVIVL